MTSLLLVCVLAASPPVPAAKPTVAVLNFEMSNPPKEGDDLSALAKGLPAMVISDLEGISQVRIIERLRMQEVLDEQKLQQSGKIDPASAVKVGKLLGAHFLVVGSYMLFDGRLMMSARVIDVTTSETTAVPKVVGKADEFIELEQKLASSLRSSLAEKIPAMKAANDAAPAKKKTPAKLPVKSAIAYSKALDDIDRKKPEEAKKKLQEVVKENPDFELAALDLASLMK